MNKFLMLVIVLMVTLFATNGLAYTPPPAPEHGWYVVDQAGKLTSGQIDQLNHKIDRISQATKNEFGILLLQDMGGDNIEDVANTTYKAWGVGKRGLDNGCLIVVAIKERKSRIENGKGVEGEVTDLQANDILKRNLNPHLKTGDFFGAFDSTLDALSGLMESRANQKADVPPVTPVHVADATENKSNSSGLLVVATVIGLGALVGFVLFLVGRANERRRQDELDAMERERENHRRQQEHLAEVRRRKEAMEREDLERQLKMPTPPSYPPTRGSFVSEFKKPSTQVRSSLKPTIIPAASDTGAHSPAALAAKREQEAAAKREREAAAREQEEADRRRRDEEAAARRRRDEEESRSSSSSSSSGFDWGSSSSGGGFDSGGGFGGGDSGGGGSSSDW